jgi:hypothetical protein
MVRQLASQDRLWFAETLGDWAPLGMVGWTTDGRDPPALRASHTGVASGSLEAARPKVSRPATITPAERRHAGLKRHRVHERTPQVGRLSLVGVVQDGGFDYVEQPLAAGLRQQSPWGCGF